MVTVSADKNKFIVKFIFQDYEKLSYNLYHAMESNIQSVYKWCSKSDIPKPECTMFDISNDDGSTEYSAVLTFTDEKYVTLAMLATNVTQ